jgi:hypothetical protein
MGNRVKVVREDGTEVKEGDEIVDFRGDKWIFIMVSSGHKIYAKKVKNGEVERDWKQEFFQSVFKLAIVEEDDVQGS